MFDDRTFDIIYLEVKLRNDELERQYQLEKLGIRARYQDAISNRESVQPVRESMGAEGNPQQVLPMANPNY